MPQDNVYKIPAAILEKLKKEHKLYCKT